MKSLSFLNITFNPKNILEFSGKYKCRPQGWAEPKQWAFPRFGILEIQKYTFFLTHNLSKPFSLKIFLKIALNYHVMVWWENTGIPTKDETSVTTVQNSFKCIFMIWLASFQSTWWTYPESYIFPAELG